jgi:hypothetical protein
MGQKRVFRRFFAYLPIFFSIFQGDSGLETTTLIAIGIGCVIALLLIVACGQKCFHQCVFDRFLGVFDRKIDVFEPENGVFEAF